MCKRCGPMKNILLTIIAAISLSLSGCNDPVETSSSESGGETHRQSPSTTEVYKYDGSLQCRGGGVSMAEMASALTENGIHVISSYSDVDGYYRIALCGATTGVIHVFEIDDSGLDQATALGFRPLSDLPGLYEPDSQTE